MSWILAILWQFAFHEMHNSCIFKKPRIWQVFWYMTWYGKNMRKKYRRRQVLWVDAWIQLPRKTGERNHTCVWRRYSRFSIFVFIIMIYFLCLLMFLECPPPPPSHTNTTTKNTGSTFAYFLVKKKWDSFPYTFTGTCKRLPAVGISLTNKNVDISLKILLIVVHC